jgi:hypothetical protein
MGIPSSVKIQTVWVKGVVLLYESDFFIIQSFKRALSKN